MCAVWLLRDSFSNALQVSTVSQRLNYKICKHAFCPPLVDLLMCHANADERSYCIVEQTFGRKQDKKMVWNPSREQMKKINAYRRMTKRNLCVIKSKFETYMNPQMTIQMWCRTKHLITMRTLFLSNVIMSQQMHLKWRFMNETLATTMTLVELKPALIAIKLRNYSIEREKCLKCCVLHGFSCVSRVRPFVWMIFGTIHIAAGRGRGAVLCVLLMPLFLSNQNCKLDIWIVRLLLYVVSRVAEMRKNRKKESKSIFRQNVWCTKIWLTSYCALVQNTSEQLVQLWHTDFALLLLSDLMCSCLASAAILKLTKI